MRLLWFIYSLNKEDILAASEFRQLCLKMLKTFMSSFFFVFFFTDS